MKKYALALLTLLLGAAFLTGCACQHQWTEATCTAPKACIQCNAVEGDPLGHSWVAADCVTAKTCSRCSQTDGNPLGHKWTEANCTAPKTCSVCKTEDGAPLEHNWTGETTLYTAPRCSICGAEGAPLPGYCAQNGLSPNVQSKVSAEYCTNTYVRPDLDTSGSFLVSEVTIFDYDRTHRTREGYEWRKAEISISFQDTRSMLYSTNVAWTVADYYQDLELTQAKKQMYFTVNYHEKDYQCLASFENIQRQFTDNSTTFQMTCYIQVPVGYDGVILTFYHGGIDITGMHLHEVHDENMLLFRLA